MTRHLLCVHGIGQHDKEWVKTEGFDKVLETAWNSYPNLKKSRGEFSENIKLHSICYDDKITEIMESWKEQSDQFKNALTGSAIGMSRFGWSTDMIDRLAQMQEDEKEKYFYTHAMDVLLYWGSLTYQEMLVSHVARQIISFITESVDLKKGDTVSVLGHSMGTSMLHNALSMLYSHELVPNRTVRKSFKFQGIFQISNTSYLLSRNHDEHYRNNKIKPSIGGSGIAKYMISVSHRLDPVSSLVPFHPPLDTWLDPETNLKQEDYYKELWLDQITGANIHSLEHYFKNPRLSSAFFTMIMDRHLPKSQINDALDAYKKSTYVGQFDSLKNELLRIKDVKDINPQNLNAIIKSYRTLLDSIKNAGGPAV